MVTGGVVVLCINWCVPLNRYCISMEKIDRVIQRCYGIRAPTRYTLHFPLPWQNTLFLHRRLPRFTGPASRSNPFRPQLSVLLMELRSNIRYVFLFHLSRLDPLRSFTGPSVRWSLLCPSYVFLFRFRSCSAFATQHRSTVLFPLSPLYDSPSLSPIGSVMW